jgi:hypothetical protein
MQKKGLLVFKLFIIWLAVFVAGCGNQKTANANSTFDKLCAIYEEVVTQDISPALKGATLSENIKNELPEFYKKHYQHLVNVDRVDRYEMIKKIAENETSRNWNCEIMESFFKGKLDK